VCVGGGGCGVSANEYSCAHEAQVNFGDLTPYLHLLQIVFRHDHEAILIQEILLNAKFCCQKT
jgi:hypothetical protein